VLQSCKTVEQMNDGGIVQHLFITEFYFSHLQKVVKINTHIKSSNHTAYIECERIT
jgi:uncharacterized protein YegJ (DUF2314 family)